MVGLYIVATPIGNLLDISARAIKVLREVDMIAAEDTRRSSNLLQHFSINTPLISMHEYNEQNRCDTILASLQQGKSVALISDAGTPLISDPGCHLVSAAREHDITIVPIPGCCALIAALSASGLPPYHFTFEGFLSAKQNAREQSLKKLANDSRTLIFYESPKRLKATLINMCEIFGKQRQACIARELTKLHETINTKRLKDLLTWVSNDQYQQKGECIILVEGVKQQISASDNEVHRILSILLKDFSVKKTAAITASLLDISKNTAYNMALKLQQK